MQKTNRPLSASNKLYRLLCCAACLCLYVPGIITTFQATAAETNRQQELESVNEKIKDVKSDISEARTETERLQEELRQTEIAAGKEALRLRGLDEKIDKQNERLRELETIISEQETVLERERAALGDQVRAAYMAGRSDYLKLLLNQEDPARVGRVLAYFEYYNRARTQTILSVQEKLDLIAKLRNNIELETAALEKLKQRQLERSNELENYRESRNVILAKLQEEIAQKGNELNSLQEHKQKLTNLVVELDKKQKREDTVAYYQDVPPFNSLKGKLDWPIKGAMLNRFGSNRKGEALKWQGVRISGQSGDSVQAVHSGRVIFADWFRNLGLLVILDHGDGYMSLYGYNQNLLKKPGDWVLAGETIAHVGDSGGQPSPAVYFEIRHNGKPVNPDIWCRR